MGKNIPNNGKFPKSLKISLKLIKIFNLNDMRIEFRIFFLTKRDLSHFILILLRTLFNFLNYVRNMKVNLYQA